MAAAAATTAVAQQARDLIARKTASNRAEYSKLVRESARGTEIDPAELLDKLESLGFDVDQFQRDAEALAARFDLAAVAATRQTHERTLAAIRVQELAAEADLVAAQQRYTAAIEKLRPTATEAENGVKAAENAVNELRRTASAEAVAKRDECQRSLNRAVERRDFALADVAGALEQIASIEKQRKEKAEHTFTTWVGVGMRDLQENLRTQDLAQLDARLAEWKDRLTRAQAAIAPAESGVVQAQAALAKAEADLLVP